MMYTDEFRAWFATMYTPVPQGCWIWKASCVGAGYGQLTLSHGKRGAAHRVSYELHKGEITEGQYVCHTCDNRRCVNPEHLFLGTQRQNLADMVAKGRSPRGVGNGASKLTEQQVTIIFARLRAGVPQNLIAKEFGVADSQISRIKLGREWSHLRGALPEMKYVRGRHYSKLNDRDLDQVRKMLESGVSQVRIAQQFGVSQSFISQIKQGKWK